MSVRTQTLRRAGSKISNRSTFFRVQFQISLASKSLGFACEAVTPCGYSVPTRSLGRTNVEGGKRTDAGELHDRRSKVR